MAGKNLNTVAKRTTIPTTGGIVTVEAGSGGETEYIEKSDIASEISDALSLGSVVTKNAGSLFGNVPILGDNITSSEIIVTNGGALVPQESKSAFNKDFAGDGSLSTVARSDHNHGGFAVRTNNVHSYNLRFTASGTTKTIGYQEIALFSNYTLTNTISPAITVILYEYDGVDYILKQPVAGYQVRVTTREAATNLISLNSVIISGITNGKIYLLNIIFKDDNGFNINAGV